MPSYLALVFRMAFARWAPRVDLFSGALGAVVPCLYVLSGRPVPDNVTTLVAEIAVGFVASGIAVRLLLAPYFIWKSDQEKIADLKRQLEEPKRLRKEAIEQAMLQARSDFAVEMRKYLDGFNASFVVHNFNAEVLEWLNSYAALFSHDYEFSDMWRVFVHVFEREISVTKIRLDRPDQDGFIEVNLNRSLGYYSQTRRVLARRIISHLMYDETPQSTFEDEIGKIKKNFLDIGMVNFYDDASLDEALAHRLQSRPEEEKPR